MSVQYADVLPRRGSDSTDASYEEKSTAPSQEKTDGDIAHS